MTPRSALVAALLLAACSSSSSPTLHECASDADCGAGNVCYAGACTANGAPVATFTAPSSAATHRMVTIAPTAIDPEARPVTFRWTVQAVDAPCEPEPEPSTGSSLEVVFWCPGTYSATVVPVDDLGLEGAPVTHSFSVAAATDVPTVSVGAPIDATHACEAGGASCKVLGPGGSASLSVTAVGVDPLGAPLAYSWKAIPPVAAATNASLVVTWTPSAEIATSTVSISSAGGAIAGTYRLRARAKSGTGLLGQAIQEVRVANAAPSFALAAGVLPHHYAGGQFVAEGGIETGAVDPDGDAISIQATLSPPAPAGCVEEVTRGTGTTFAVRITCTEPSALIGPTPRTLEVTAADSDGATQTVSSPVAIGNQPPVVELDPALAGVLAVGHRVEPCTLGAVGSCFAADGVDPFVVSDPDGDPLSAYELTATAADNRPSSKGAVIYEAVKSRFRFETPVSLPLEFRSAAGATGFTVGAKVKDPWGAAAVRTAALSVGNRPPVVKEAVPSVQVNHVYDAPERRFFAAADGALFEDPDGDPLSSTVALYERYCGGAAMEGGRAKIACSLWWDYTLGGTPPILDFIGIPDHVTVRGWDGWAGVDSTTAVSIMDRPPTLSAPVSSVESCACAYATPCWKLILTTTGVAVPVQYADPDGDPALLVAEPTFGTASSPATYLPGWCYPRVSSSLGTHISGTVSAKQGAFMPTVKTSFGVTATCTASGLCCK